MRFLPASLPAVLSAAFLAAAPAFGEVDRALQNNLESTYAAWRQAFSQKDSVRWLAQTSRYRQVVLRNQVVSQNLPWPRAVFSLAIQPPELIKLKVLEARSVKDVARVVYYGKVDFGIPGEAAPDNALVIWFLKETDGWKFNAVQYVNLTDGEAKLRASNGDLSFLQEDEFAIDGKYPEIPKLCETPYHMARLEVIASGCTLSVGINGQSEEKVNQTAASRVVIGGLRKGPNKLSLSPQATTKDPAKIRLEVKLFIPTGNPAKPESELFAWKYDPAKPLEKQDFTVWAPSKVSRGM